MNNSNHQESNILSGREIMILQLVMRGYTNQQIAVELEISTRTVGFHMENIFKKLEVRCRMEAAIKAILLNYIKLPTN